jgi:hypothetical protein
MATCALGTAGKLKGMTGKALLAPMLLIFCKTILFPVLIALFLTALGAGGEVEVNGEKFSLLLFGFLMGAFCLGLPTPPPPHTHTHLTPCPRRNVSVCAVHLPVCG